MKVTVVHWEGDKSTWTDIEVLSSAELSHYINCLNKDTSLILDYNKEGPSCTIFQSLGLNYELNIITDDKEYTLVDLPGNAGVLSVDVEYIKLICDISFRKTLQAASYFLAHRKMDMSLTWVAGISDKELPPFQLPKFP